MKAKAEAWKEWYEELDTKEGEDKIYRIARARAQNKKDIAKLVTVKDRNGKLLVDEERIRARWVEYFLELLNVKNERAELPKEPPVVRPEKEPTRQMVEEAIKVMKMGKAAGPSGTTAELWKHLGQTGLEWPLEILKDIWAEGRVSKQWKKSEIVTIYKEKVNPLKFENYRGMKLLVHGLKIMEKVLDKRLRKIININ